MILPDLFVKNMRSILGNEADDFFSAFDKKVNMGGLRVNTLKIQPDEIHRLLDELPLTPIPWCPSGFYFPLDLYNNRPSKNPLYHAGLYYLQEPSAMAPVEVLTPKPGDAVLDLCAAPGGKAAQIAGYLQGEGVLVANDASASRSRALVRNLTLCGVKNAVILNETPMRLAARFGGFFDKILIDAPCSGEGMFRKDADAVQAWTSNKPKMCAALQNEILHHAADMLKPGGHMVYSTCTFNTEENEEMIAYFLDKHSEFNAVQIDYDKFGFSNGLPPVKEAARLWPHKINGEGHFICKLHKNVHGNAVRGKTIKSDKKNKARRNNDKNTAVYLSPENLPDLNGLRVARSGLYVGDEKKGRFEYSHDYALSLKRNEWDYVYDLTADECEKYLRGESLEADLSCENKSWVLMCVSGYPLGWAKFVNNRLKNKYPNGWVLK